MRKLALLIGLCLLAGCGDQSSNQHPNAKYKVVLYSQRYIMTDWSIQEPKIVTGGVEIVDLDGKKAIYIGNVYVQEQ